MEFRQLLALALAFLTLAGVVGAILYATREWRAERRGFRRAERRRKAKMAEQQQAELPPGE